MPLAKLGWREEAVALDQPGRVVGLPEREQRLPQLLDGLEGPYPEQVFLQRADEALGAAIAFWCPHEGGRTLDAEEGQFLLEVVRHVLRAVVVAHDQTAGDCLGEPAEMLPHPLADRLQSLEAGGPRMSVNADTFGGAMIDRDEHELFAEVGDGLTERRRRIVGVFEPPLLQQRSDTPCPMLPWSSCFNQGRLLTRSPRCCATERVPCWRKRLRQKWPNFSPSMSI